MLTGNFKGAAGGKFGVGEFDVVNGLEGVGLGVDGVVEAASLIAVSFCCDIGVLGGFSSKLGNAFALLSCDFASVQPGPNKGDVANEKGEGADEAAD